MSINGPTLDNESIDYIKSILPEGQTILELGSGEGTIKLSEYYNMISVENQREWQDRYPICTKYINVGHKMYNETDFKKPDNIKNIPSQNGWYDPNELQTKLPAKTEYDLILIDGPGGWLGRAGFITYLEYFNTEVPIILDDVHREQELMIIKKLSEILGREYKIINKSLGCIL